MKIEYVPFWEKIVLGLVGCYYQRSSLIKYRRGIVLETVVEERKLTTNLPFRDVNCLVSIIAAVKLFIGLYTSFRMFLLASRPCTATAACICVKWTAILVVFGSLSEKGGHARDTNVATIALKKTLSLLLSISISSHSSQKT